MAAFHLVPGGDSYIYCGNIHHDMERNIEMNMKKQHSFQMFSPCMNGNKNDFI